ncbi:hypothetical protein [Klebsiella pneumoniae]|uniref:hypothetical protein n=1 Tax=Klebsiella pneumoniae TaxID=573 RepID=UPI00300AFA9B
MKTCIPYIIKSCKEKKKEGGNMINKLHNLENVMDSTFATGHSTWLRYVLRNSVSTLGDLKIAAKQVCSSNAAKDESTELQCSIAVSYCSTLQSISIILQVAVELETLHQNDAFLRSTFEYLKRNGIYDHDIIFDMLKKVSLTDCEKIHESIVKAQFGVELLEARISFGSRHFPIRNDIKRFYPYLLRKEVF